MERASRRDTAVVLAVRDSRDRRGMQSGSQSEAVQGGRPGCIAPTTLTFAATTRSHLNRSLLAPRSC